jgi:hypothetical protein
MQTKTPVDVLSVLFFEATTLETERADAERLGSSGDVMIVDARLTEMRETRTAVAELIAAASEVDRQNQAPGHYCETGKRIAAERLRAALAACGVRS